MSSVGARLVPASTFFEMARRSQRLHLSDLQPARASEQPPGKNDDDTASTASTASSASSASTASTASTGCPLTSLRVFDPRDTRILERIARSRAHLSAATAAPPSAAAAGPLKQSKRHRQQQRHKCVCMSSNVRQRIQVLTASTASFKAAAASADKARRRATKRLRNAKRVLTGAQRDVWAVRAASVRRMVRCRAQRLRRLSFAGWRTAAAAAQRSSRSKTAALAHGFAQWRRYTHQTLRRRFSKLRLQHDETMRNLVDTRVRLAQSQKEQVASHERLVAMVITASEARDCQTECILRRALRRIQSTLLRTAWSNWLTQDRRVVAAAQQSRRLALLAVFFRQKTHRARQLGVLRTWRARARSLRARYEKNVVCWKRARNAILGCARRFQHARREDVVVAFATWRRHTFFMSVRDKRFQSLAWFAQSAAKRQNLRSALRAWARHTQAHARAQQMQANVSKRIARTARHLKFSAWDTWKRKTARVQSRRRRVTVLAASCISRTERSRAVHTFLRWRVHAQGRSQWRETLRRALIIAYKSKTTRTLRFTWALLRERLLTCPRKRARTTRVDRRGAQKRRRASDVTRARLFQTWRAWAETRLRHRREAVFVRLSRLESIAGKQRVRFAASATAALHKAWQAWNTTVVMQQGLEAMQDIGDHLRASALVRLYLLRSHRSALFQSFYRWRETTESLLPAESIIAECQNKVEDAQELSVFASKRFLKRVVMNALLRAPLRKAMSRWTYWCYRDHIAEAHDNAAWHHVRRAKLLQTRRVWAQWRQRVATQAARRTLHRVVVRRQRRRALRVAFSQRWFNGVVLASRQRQAQLVRIARNIRCRMRRVAMHAWRRYTHIDRGLKALRGRLRRRHRRYYFWRWRMFCKHASSTKRVLVGILKRIATSNKEAAMRRHWRTWWQQAHGGALKVLVAKHGEEVSRLEETHAIVVAMHLKNIHTVKTRLDDATASHVESERAHLEAFDRAQERGRMALEDATALMESAHRKAMHDVQASHRKKCDDIQTEARHAFAREEESKHRALETAKALRAQYEEAKVAHREALAVLAQNHAASTQQIELAAARAREALKLAHEKDLLQHRAEAMRAQEQAVSNVEATLAESHRQSLAATEAVHRQDVDMLVQQRSASDARHDSAVRTLQHALEAKHSAAASRQRKEADRVYALIVEEKKMLTEQVLTQRETVLRAQSEHDAAMQALKRRHEDAQEEVRAEAKAERASLKDGYEQQIAGIRSALGVEAEQKVQEIEHKVRDECQRESNIRCAAAMQKQRARRMNQRHVLVAMHRWRRWHGQACTVRSVRATRIGNALKAVMAATRRRMLRHDGWRRWQRWTRDMHMKSTALGLLLKASTRLDRRGLTAAWSKWRSQASRVGKLERFLGALCQHGSVVRLRAVRRRWGTWTSKTLAHRVCAQALLHLCRSKGTTTLRCAWRRWRVRCVAPSRKREVARCEALRRCLVVTHVAERARLRLAMLALSRHAKAEGAKARGRAKAIVWLSRMWARHHHKERCRRVLRKWFALAAVAGANDAFAEDLELRLQKATRQFPWSFFSQIRMSLDSMLPWVNPAGGNAFVGKIAPARASSLLASGGGKEGMLLAADNAAGVVDLLHRRSGVDYDPIDKDCACYACARYSRSHLYHLFKAKSSHAQHLVALHNLHYTVKSLVAIMEEEPELARRVRQYFPANEVSPPGGGGYNGVTTLPLSPPQVRRRRMAVGIPSPSRRGIGKGSSSTGALRRDGIGRRRAERGRERRLRRMGKRMGGGEKEGQEGKVGMRIFRSVTDRSKIVDGTNRYAGLLTKWEHGASEGEEDDYESSGSYFDFEQPLITPESSVDVR